MDAASVTQPFVPFYEPMRRPSVAPGLSSSIWAPQPQPSDTAWSNAIASFGKTNDDAPKDSARPDFKRASSHPSGRNGEDVFGPVGHLGSQKRDVGAIGDGRKKSYPDYDAMVSPRYTNSGALLY